MRRRRLERLFARYRRRGDLGALAEVFDRTAVDLLRLAQHLARENADAEDLLQETFVTAIERAASWEPARPLLPWLAGILAHKAAALRRREGRVLGAETVERVTESGPLEAAVARELSTEVGRALQNFGAAERALLEPYLRGERAPSELASELGLAPGTVRMRIHRGLERLRRLLPAGVGAGVLGIATSQRGLAAVRRAVLAHAARTATVPTVTTLSTGGAAALTLAMTKTTILLGSIAGALAIAGALYLAHGSPALVASSPESGLRAPSAALPLGDHRAHGPADPGVAGAGARPLDDKPSERRAITQKSLRIEGRVLGVSPEHMEGVRVTIVPAADDGTGTGTLFAMGELACTNERGGVACTNCHATPRAREVDLEENGDQIWQPVDRLVAPAVREYSTEHPDELAGLRVDEEGRFSVEIGELFEAEDAVLPQFFELFAEHELYFSAMLVVEFLPLDRELFLADVPVALSGELELQPAAVLRGTLLAEEAQPVEVFSRAATWEPVQRDLVLALEDLAVAEIQTSFEISLSVAELGEVESGTWVIRSVPILTHLFYDSGATVALFRLENGRPLPAPVAQTQVQPGNAFELKLAEEGEFVLVACQDGKRPRTILVRLRLREVTTLEPFALDAGAFLEGTLVTAQGAGECSVVASRQPSSDDLAIELSPHDLVWSNGAFEWRSVTSGVDEQAHFRIDGLAPAFHGLSTACAVELDMARSAAQARGEALTTCLAPSSGLVLAPDYALLEVQLAQSGASLEELPAAAFAHAEDPTAEGLEESASTPVQPPTILLRVSVGEVETAGEYTFVDRTRALVLVDPSARVRLELRVGETLRDELELLSPPAGSRESVRLELGKL